MTNEIIPLGDPTELFLRGRMCELTDDFSRGKIDFWTYNARRDKVEYTLYAYHRDKYLETEMPGEAN